MQSVYGLLSTEPICSLPKVIGQAYMPYYPGYVYAAVSSNANWKMVSKIYQIECGSMYFLQGFIVTYCNSRPKNLVFHNHEFHVFDLKVNKDQCWRCNLKVYLKACDCPDISFGTVDEVMKWQGAPVLYHCMESCELRRTNVVIINLTKL